MYENKILLYCVRKNNSGGLRISAKRIKWQNQQIANQIGGTVWVKVQRTEKVRQFGVQWPLDIVPSPVKMAKYRANLILCSGPATWFANEDTQKHPHFSSKQTAVIGKSNSVAE